MVQEKIKEIKLPAPNKDSKTCIEYNFDDAQNFYEVLLNFETMVRNGPWRYTPAVDGQLRWIFRGQWDSTKGLRPTAFRPELYENLIMPPKQPIQEGNKQDQQKPIKEKDKHKHQRLIDQIRIECTLLKEFMETANTLGIDCSYTPSLYDYMKEIEKDYYADGGEYVKKQLLINCPFLDSSLKWPTNSIFPLLSLARHHGIPTRLLDFTYNSLFAAFFASSEPFFQNDINPNNNEKLCIWAINEKTEIRKGGDLVKIPATSNRSGNLFAQEGLLMLDKKANKHFMDTGKWRDLETLIEPKRLIKLTLPQTKYKKLLGFLWHSNITPARVMPNLDKVTQTLEYNQWLYGQIKRKKYPPLLTRRHK